jgi:hypothetical protein
LSRIEDRVICDVFDIRASLSLDPRFHVKSPIAMYL